VIYNMNGKKMHEKKGVMKNVVYVNRKENLVVCGCRNGLLEVY
jgi:hypothetical protein